MANYATSKRKEHRALVRRYLVLYPDASNRQIADALGFDKDYVGKHIRKVRLERAHRVNRETLNVAVAEMEDIYNELVRQSFEIVRTTKNDNAKIGAIRTIADITEKMFNIKFDAGVFKRNLGELKTLTHAEVLEVVHKQLNKQEEG